MKLLDSRTIAFALTALVGLAGHDAGAQTLYKLIDKNGKVTYAEKPPKDFDGKVIRMDIDPNANTATLPRPAPSAPVDRAQQRTASEDRAKQGRERLESARKALAEARDNPGEGDIVRIGKAGGGARPQASEDYQRRLEGLEKDVKEAEEELRRAEGR